MERLRAWGVEMREVHRLLREALDLARESIEDDDTADPLERTVMQTHFRYEERRLLDVLDRIGDDTPTTAELFGPLG